MSKYLNECLRFERLIFGRVKLSHIKGENDMLREFYMLYLHIVSWTQYTYKMLVVFKQEALSFYGCLTFFTRI